MNHISILPATACQAVPIGVLDGSHGTGGGVEPSPSYLLPIGFQLLSMYSFTLTEALPSCGNCWIQFSVSLEPPSLCVPASPLQVSVLACCPTPELRDSNTKVVLPLQSSGYKDLSFPPPLLRGPSTKHHLRDGSSAPQGPSCKLLNLNNPNPGSGKWLLHTLVFSCCLFSSSVSSG